MESTTGRTVIYTAVCSAGSVNLPCVTDDGLACAFMVGECEI
jgi:hypothetical protein